MLRTVVFLLFATCSVSPAFAGPCTGAEAQLVRVSRELTLAATDMAEGMLRPIALSHPDCPEVLLAKARIEEALGKANQAVDLYTATPISSLTTSRPRILGGSFSSSVTI